MPSILWNRRSSGRSMASIYLSYFGLKKKYWQNWFYSFWNWFDLKEFIDPIPCKRARTRTLTHTYTQIYTRKQLRLSLSKDKLIEFSAFTLVRCTFAQKLLVKNIFIYARKHLASTVHDVRKMYKMKATNTILVRTESFMYVCADLFLPKKINGDGGWSEKESDK